MADKDPSPSAWAPTHAVSEAASVGRRSARSSAQARACPLENCEYLFRRGCYRLPATLSGKNLIPAASTAGHPPVDETLAQQIPFGTCSVRALREELEPYVLAQLLMDTRVRVPMTVEEYLKERIPDLVRKDLPPLI
eukprot:gb/GEZJ01003970.1/.p2 GENE.gb/GEZJ01003970.1/~~gb/GEZJ01003970.1/.p2  ORF type:complete len:137 (+),score=8.10 gb/GEZJ01003970.1/:2588-2998(+)